MTEKWHVNDFNIKNCITEQFFGLSLIAIGGKKCRIHTNKIFQRLKKEKKNTCYKQMNINIYKNVIVIS